MCLAKIPTSLGVFDISAASEANSNDKAISQATSVNAVSYPNYTHIEDRPRRCLSPSHISS